MTFSAVRLEREAGDAAQARVRHADTVAAIARPEHREELVTRTLPTAIRPGWVHTIHSAQGATAERMVAHLESFRASAVDTHSAYVAISCARTRATIYTDSRADLTTALGLRDGKRIGALDEVWGRDPPPITTSQPAMTAVMTIGREPKV